MDSYYRDFKKAQSLLIAFGFQNRTNLQKKNPIRYAQAPQYVEASRMLRRFSVEHPNCTPQWRHVTQVLAPNEAETESSVHVVEWDGLGPERACRRILPIKSRLTAQTRTAYVWKVTSTGWVFAGFAMKDVPCHRCSDLVSMVAIATEAGDSQTSPGALNPFVHLDKLTFKMLHHRFQHHKTTLHRILVERASLEYTSMDWQIVRLVLAGGLQTERWLLFEKKAAGKEAFLSATKDIFKDRCELPSRIEFMLKGWIEELSQDPILV